MTPKQMAEHDCSNLMACKCIGVTKSCFPNASEQSPADRCLVAEGKRCPFFENAVLPLADRPSPKDDPGLQGRRQETRNAYIATHDPKRPKPIAGRRNCPRCGTLLDTGKRYCDPCRKLRRDETNRKNLRKWRTKKV